MDRRRNRRVAVFMTVRIWGVDAKSVAFAQHAQVRNISDRGAVLQGIMRPLRAGSILHVQHDKDQAQFRIVWVGNQGHSGRAKSALRACLPSRRCGM